MGNRINTHVYVTVDTIDINEQNKNDKVEFSDNRGDPPSKLGIPKDFISKVDRGKRVYWSGIVKDPSKNSGNTVAIKEIKRKSLENSSKILRKKCYKDNGDSGVVRGKVKFKYVNGFEHYYLTLLVNGTDTYTIDPQLIMVK